MPKAMLFNIQRFSLHDGPGIRTTLFFKGCPLHCLWCHNPESQNRRQEMLYDRETCVLCGVCQRYVPKRRCGRAIYGHRFGEAQFVECHDCIPLPGRFAREYTVEEVVVEAIKDRVFYQESNGVDSPGRTLMQIDFWRNSVLQRKVFTPLWIPAACPRRP